MLIIGTAVFGLNGNLFLTTDGTNVTSYLPLGTQPTQSLWSKVQYGAYLMWSDSWQFPEQYGTLTFKAVATNDIAVGISAIDPWNVLTSGIDLYVNLISPSNFYELVIGGWGNTQSAIRQGAQTEPVATVPSGIPVQGVLVEYKVILYQDKKHNDRDTLAIFYLDPNTQIWTKLIEYHGSKFAVGPRWFSLSSWDTNIFYEGIEFSDSTKLPV
jgi:hypothetical protein